MGILPWYPPSNKGFQNPPELRKDLDNFIE